MARNKIVFAVIAAIAIAAVLFVTFYPHEKPPLAREALPNSTFANLPPFPGDFFEKHAALREGKKNVGDYSEEYWKQPEFYPNFESYGISAMLNPPQGKWAAQGYSAYPSEGLAQAEPGETVEKVVMFRTSWLVESNQGMGLKHHIESANGSNGFFAVSITPREFLLGPAYPVFASNWVQRVVVKVLVSPSTPPGEYFILLEPAKPSKSDEWRKAYPLYFDSTGFGLSKPFYRLRLVVQ